MKGLSREMMLGTAGLCVSLALGIGLYTRIAPFGSKAARRAAAAAAGLLVCVVGGYVSFAPLRSGSLEREWQAFSPQVLEEAHMTGRHVMANFTASWCMNCQYNKLRVLNSAQIRRLIDEKQMVRLEVDLTNKNPEGESLMEHLGSRSVPFLAVFPGDDPYRPIIMRDILSTARLAHVLEGLPGKEE